MSKAQLQLVKRTDANLQRLKWRAIRIACSTIALYVGLIVALFAVLFRQT